MKFTTFIVSVVAATACASAFARPANEAYKQIGNRTWATKPEAVTDDAVAKFIKAPSLLAQFWIAGMNPERVQDNAYAELPVLVNCAENFGNGVQMSTIYFVHGDNEVAVLDNKNLGVMPNLPASEIHRMVCDATFTNVQRNEVAKLASAQREKAKQQEAAKKLQENSIPRTAFERDGKKVSVLFVNAFKAEGMRRFHFKMIVTNGKGRVVEETWARGLCSAPKQGLEVSEQPMNGNHGWMPLETVDGLKSDDAVAILEAACPKAAQIW